jgi:hypothetical protein
MFLGSILMAFGASLASSTNIMANISSINAITGFIMSIVMFFFGGFLFAIVAAAMKKD